MTVAERTRVLGILGHKPPRGRSGLPGGDVSADELAVYVWTDALGSPDMPTQGTVQRVIEHILENPGVGDGELGTRVKQAFAKTI